MLASQDDDGPITLWQWPRLEVDYGDAVDDSSQGGFGYKTLPENGGPVHLVDDSVRLGATVTGGRQASPNRYADGDDYDDVPNGDDEDGLVDRRRDLSLIRGVKPAVEIQVTNQTDKPAQLIGMIDYNGDGTFQINVGQSITEHAALEIAAGFSGTVTLRLPEVPAGAVD